jgi:hypothetical protein
MFESVAFGLFTAVPVAPWRLAVPILEIESRHRPASWPSPGLGLVIAQPPGSKDSVKGQVGAVTLALCYTLPMNPRSV